MSPRAWRHFSAARLPAALENIFPIGPRFRLMPLPTTPTRIHPSLAAAVLALGMAVALVLSASSAHGVLRIGQGNGVPYGYSPKDFTILQRDGVFHAYYILVNIALANGSNLQQHLNQRRFGHATSTDLMSWTFVDSAFGVAPGAFDRHHIWAPTLLWADGRYWMFYTGVEDTMTAGSWLPKHMQIGLAWSYDLVTWSRSTLPIFRCGPPDSPWADCDEGGLRDPYVMRADTSATGTGWFMYFVTQPGSAPPGYYDPLAFVVGTASGYEGDMTEWNDFGPKWSTYRTYQQQPGELTNKVESPHLFRHAGVWYLFFTGDQGIVSLIGTTPVGDVPVYQGEWDYRGTFDEVSPNEFASEMFQATWAGGFTESYFATVKSIGNQLNEVVLRILNPTAGGPLLADPLVLSEIRPLIGGVRQGESLRVYFGAEPSTVEGTVNQVIRRPAPLEIWEADDSLGVRTWSQLVPESIGVPSLVQVTVHEQVQDHGDTLVLRPKWDPDDDDTPNRIEIQFRCRGAVSGVVGVTRPGHGVTGVDDAAAGRLALRAEAVPGGGAMLRLELPARARARLDLYDVHGRHVRTVLDEWLEPGTRVVGWDGRDGHGAPVPSGITFALLRAGGESARARVLTIH